MFFLVFAGCSNHPLADTKPFGTIVDKEVTCTDVLQKVEDGYEYRSSLDEPTTLFGEDCFIEKYKDSWGYTHGNEWMRDTWWTLTIRRFDTKDGQWPAETTRQWPFFEYVTYSKTEDGVENKYIRTDYTYPEIGSLYYPAHMYWPGSARVPDDLLKLMREATPVRWGEYEIVKIPNDD